MLEIKSRHIDHLYVHAYQSKVEILNNTTKWEIGFSTNLEVASFPNWAAGTPKSFRGDALLFEVLSCAEQKINDAKTLSSTPPVYCTESNHVCPSLSLLSPSSLCFSDSLALSRSLTRSLSLSLVFSHTNSQAYLLIFSIRPAPAQRTFCLFFCLFVMLSPFCQGCIALKPAFKTPYPMPSVLLFFLAIYFKNIPPVLPQFIRKEWENSLRRPACVPRTCNRQGAAE